MQGGMPAVGSGLGTLRLHAMQNNFDSEMLRLRNEMNNKQMELYE